MSTRMQPIAAGYARRAGFTLLEILIAVLLSTVVLSSVWSLLNIYGKLFETGQAKATKAQLLRGLAEQITADLRSAIQDTAPASAGSITAQSRFGLFGTARELRIDIMQAGVAPQVTRDPTLENVADALEPPPAAEAYELRTVEYRFVERPADEEAEVSPVAGLAGTPAASLPQATKHYGLVRSEFDWQTPPPASLDAVPAAMTSEPAMELAAGEDSPPTDIGSLEGLSAPEDSVTWVPEVTSIEFQYYDGTAWYTSWDSIQRKSLPVAVKVSLYVDSGDQPSKATPPPTADAVTDTAVDDAIQAAITGEEPFAPTGDRIDLLVDLPAAALHRQIDEYANQFNEMVDDWWSGLEEEPEPEPQADADMGDADLADVMASINPAYAAVGSQMASPSSSPDPFNRRRDRRTSSPTQVLSQPPPDQWMRRTR